MIGALTAPISSVAVSDHWASLSDTPISRETSGTSGAPSDETMATTHVTRNRTGVSSRSRVAAFMPGPAGGPR